MHMHNCTYIQIPTLQSSTYYSKSKVCNFDTSASSLMTFGKQCKKEFFFRDLSTFCKLDIKFLQTGMEDIRSNRRGFVSMKLDVSFIRFFLSLAWLENYWLNFTGNRRNSWSGKKSSYKVENFLKRTYVNT